MRFLLRRAWTSVSRKLLIIRGLLSLLAWVLYYTAAKDLTLAEMTTLYFSAPIMVTLLAALILKERASRGQWISLVIGFVGVIIACRPSNMLDPVPIALTLAAALCWAFTYIQLRQVDPATSVLEQMLITNVVFVICMAVTLPLASKAMRRCCIEGERGESKRASSAREQIIFTGRPKAFAPSAAGMQ